SEKASLLPVTETQKLSTLQENDDEATPNQLRIAEFALLFLTFLLAGFQTFILNFDFASSCIFGPHFLPIAQGLPQSLFIGFPTTAIFLIAAPVLAKKERVGFVRCLIMFCYLLGATWGAVI
ncbi:hypothetical protein K469DRAFT_475330, partial [Zopfia rhizophila CBS 207.26]